jgi:hypothetical protein
MHTSSTLYVPSLYAWIHRLEPFGWSLSVICFLLVGMISIQLPTPMLTALLIGVASGPMLHLARRTARTVLLIMLLIVIECMLYLASLVLNTAFHVALFHILFAIVLCSLGHAFAASPKRGLGASVMAGMLWTVSAAACLAAVVLVATGLMLLSAGVQSQMLARLPLIDLLLALGAGISSFALPIEAQWKKHA